MAAPPTRFQLSASPNMQAARFCTITQEDGTSPNPVPFPHEDLWAMDDSPTAGEIVYSFDDYLEFEGRVIHILKRQDTTGLGQIRLILPDGFRFSDSDDTKYTFPDTKSNIILAFTAISFGYVIVHNCTTAAPVANPNSTLINFQQADAIIGNNTINTLFNTTHSATVSVSNSPSPIIQLVNLGGDVIISSSNLKLTTLPNIVSYLNQLYYNNITNTIAWGAVPADAREGFSVTIPNALVLPNAGTTTFTGFSVIVIGAYNASAGLVLATGLYTAPQTGRYMVHMLVTYSSSAATAILPDNVTIRLLGVALGSAMIQYTQQITSSTSVTLSFCSPMILVAGTVYSFQLINTIGAGAIQVLNTNRARFSIQRIV